MDKNKKIDKKKQAFLELVQSGIDLVRTYGPDPEDKLLTVTLAELERIKEMAMKQWPFSRADKDTVRIGLFALRELQGVVDRVADICIRVQAEVEDG